MNVILSDHTRSGRETLFHCPDCDGTGFLLEDGEKCGRCDGTGTTDVSVCEWGFWPPTDDDTDGSGGSPAVCLGGMQWACTAGDTVGLSEGSVVGVSDGDVVG